jgi:hypothetical protein
MQAEDGKMRENKYCEKKLVENGKSIGNIVLYGR